MISVYVIIYPIVGYALKHAVAGALREQPLAPFGTHEAAYMGQLPKRKQNRLKNFDYSQPCVVLLTVCADRRGPVFGNVEAQASPPFTVLFALGELVKQSILEMEAHYQNLVLEIYSILPDHIHLLLRLEHTEIENPPSISQIVRMLKSTVTRKWGEPVWQKGFHDHII